MDAWMKRTVGEFLVLYLTNISLILLIQSIPR